MKSDGVEGKKESEEALKGCELLKERKAGLESTRGDVFTQGFDGGVAVSALVLIT